MKKVLFIDRDGTLIIEPPTDFQVDSLEKLEFYPGVFQNLSRIVRELDYELVMVTNQDGLGTVSFPEEKFRLPHEKMLKAFINEGIVFSEVLIDRSFESDHSPNRKPGIGMLQHFLKGGYDLKRSFVIGDRLTDVQLAENLGTRAILISKESTNRAALTTTDWSDIYTFLSGQPRLAQISRATKETTIELTLNLDGNGICAIHTGLPFFDHMLEQFGRHGNFDLNIQVQGDLQVDEHHTVEDVGLTLGEAFMNALGSRKGIERYGFTLPMDDCLAQVAIDFGGRPWIVWDAIFHREKIGAVPTEMFFHFFKSFSDTARCNLNIKAEGQNEHHKIESVFKAFAKSLRMAVKHSGYFSVPSTKGVL